MARISAIFFLIYVFSLSAEPANILTLDEVLADLNHIQDGGVEFHWDPIFQTGMFSVSEHYVSFQVGTPGETGLAVLDGQEILSPPAPYLEKGQLHFPKEFVSALRMGLEKAVHPESLFRIAAVIVDPGHGGKDTGAIGNHTINGKSIKLLEKDITLKVSKDLFARLKQGFPDKQILLTRTEDTYPTLDERVNLANAVRLKENEAIIYISIHANATFRKDVRGYEVWYLKPDYQRTVLDPDKYEGPKEVASIVDLMLQEEFLSESIRMAGAILKQFEAVFGKTLPSRGLKAEEWFVVRNAKMPAILVELGFVTNEADALLFSDDASLKKFGEALYKGISDFIAEFEGSEGYTVVE
ncbi:MAG: N-acetylmuramoyl-L-alanine amidase [Spirochaetaceae bacterium]|jgi:N-acetylmuramoyl-L-alanine amidase|nr:N-acetylmuramoyl-L-alanine amidase [Spirochaetaceae bacterium]